MSSRHLSESLANVLQQYLLNNSSMNTEYLREVLLGELERHSLPEAEKIRERLKDQDNFIPFVAELLDLPFVDLKKSEIPSSAISAISAQLANHYQVFPVKVSDNSLLLAVDNPLDILKIDELKVTLPCDLQVVLAEGSAIKESIRKHYGLGAETIERMLADSPERMKIKEPAAFEDLTTEASIGGFVNQLIVQAHQEGATDIHIEPTAQGLAVRYRVDGFLRDAKVPANLKHFKDAINSRIKILAHLNIAEKRLPQDGRFQIKANDSHVDLRVSFLPTSFGESLVIRILNPDQLFNLDELGLSISDQRILDTLIHKPHGIIFVTGPTGSGKTTTLYSCLSKLNKQENKIITIEDPIEYQLKGITQIQINPAIGLTFAQGLRSMLRHDPDIMMVGEVRDEETAQIAIQVALTGHLVFSTLHTNDSAGSVTRLLDMGIEPYLLSSSILCFMAQRLVRVACPKCKRTRKADAAVVKDFGVTIEESQSARLVEAVGCRECSFTGYLGRKGIYEFLVLDDELKRMIHDRAPAGEIRSKAMEKGMKTLRQDGWDKVRQGLTTTEEVLRVTQEEV